jgi:hypothetical protein
LEEDGNQQQEESQWCEGPNEEEADFTERKAFTGHVRLKEWPPL